MTSKHLIFTPLILALATQIPSMAQVVNSDDDLATISEVSLSEPVGSLGVDSLQINIENPDTIICDLDVDRWYQMDSLRATYIQLDTLAYIPQLPGYFFLPAAYEPFEFTDSVTFNTPLYSDNIDIRWLEEQTQMAKHMKRLRKHLFYNSPELVKYNLANMLEAPKVFHAVVNPDNHRIEVQELATIVVNEPTLTAEQVKPRHWIRKFNASLQFSQAYVSPNWYQGGNNNLNLLGQLYYNVKLNEEYHPNILVDFTAQYKLGLNSAPDDSLRNYSISEDLFQLNGTFGIKAVKHWYYSFTGQFKTQLLNSYNSNTRNLRASFLSPGDFTGGIGMTYNYKDNRVTFDANLPILSYNMKMCTNSKLNETAFGIKPGHTTYSSFGSTVEFRLSWKMAYNITLDSRLFTFTDYKQLQTDWENTLSFQINQFLTTRIYAHMRYDTKGIPAAGTNWKKLQLKEILSFGFAYKFSSI